MPCTHCDNHHDHKSIATCPQYVLDRAYHIFTQGTDPFYKLGEYATKFIRTGSVTHNSTVVRRALHGSMWFKDIDGRCPSDEGWDLCNHFGTTHKYTQEFNEEAFIPKYLKVLELLIELHNLKFRPHLGHFTCSTTFQKSPGISKARKYKIDREGNLTYTDLQGDESAKYLKQYNTWFKSFKKELLAQRNTYLQDDRRFVNVMCGRGRLPEDSYLEPVLRNYQRERQYEQAAERYHGFPTPPYNIFVNIRLTKILIYRESEDIRQIERELDREERYTAQQEQRHRDFAASQQRAQEMRENGLPSSTQPQPTDNLPPAVDAPIESDTCAICMDPIGKVNCVTIRCGHQFCGDCIFHHLQMAKGTCCPMCRKEYAVRPPQYIPSQRHNVGELPIQETLQLMSRTQVPQQLTYRLTHYNPAQHNNVGELPIQRPRPRPRPSGRPRPTNI